MNSNTKELFKFLLLNKKIDKKFNTELNKKYADKEISLESYFEQIDCACYFRLIITDAVLRAFEGIRIRDGEAIVKIVPDDSNTFMLYNLAADDVVHCRLWKLEKTSEDILLDKSIFDYSILFDGIINIPSERVQYNPNIDQNNLLILLHKINVDGKSRVRATHLISQLMQNLNAGYDKLFNDNPNSKLYVHPIYLPIRDKESSVECIYPVKSEIVNIDEIFKRINAC